MVKKFSPRIQRKRQLVKQRIIEAAYEIFCRKGYENTTLEEIADKVGLVKSGLLYYFHSKEELFIEVIKFRSFVFFSELEKVSFSGLSMAEAGVLILKYSCKMLFKDPDFFRLFLPIQFSGNPPGAVRVLKRFTDEVHRPAWENMLDFSPDEREMLIKVVWSLFLGVCHFYLAGRKGEARKFMKEAEVVIRKTFS